jgi:hypothetical protein
LAARYHEDIRRFKVTAINGPAAAQRLAIDIVNQIRSVRPVPATL